MIITRRRLRRRGYVLINTARAESIITLKGELRDMKNLYASAVKQRLSEQDTVRPAQFDIDLLDMKYQRALKRILELEGEA